MDKQKTQNHPIQVGKFYRCRPTMSEASIIQPYLVQLQGLNLQFFHLKDFSFYKRLPIISKEDLYSAQLSILSPKILVIFGLQKFLLFSIESMQTIQTVKTNSYIQKFQIRSNYIIILSSDQDSQQKIINCWKICPQSGKVEHKFKSTPFLPLQYEQCTEDNLCLSLILSIEGEPKIYVYWRDTNYMIQIDPKNQTTQIYNRHNKISITLDLTKDSYAEVSGQNIIINSKKTGKKLAQLTNQGQIFTQLFTDGASQSIYTLSNFGLKKWKLESNSKPSLYTASSPSLSKIFITPTTIYSINSHTNTIFIWQNPQQYQSHSFPTESIRSALTLNSNSNSHQAFFLLEASSSLEEQNQQGKLQLHVTKHHKLEIYDFQKDVEIGKKAMVKSQHSVQMGTVVVKDGVVRFVVRERAEEGEGKDKGEKGEKKYLVKWTPFEKDQNGKDTKKKEIKGANGFDVIKVYDFNRILGLTLAKKAQAFSLFLKEQEQKTQVVLFDFSAKKIGDYDLQGQIKNVQLSQKNLLYAITPTKIIIYSIAIQNKNRLQKLTQLEISAISLTPYHSHLLIQKQSSFLLLDPQFQCIIRQQIHSAPSSFPSSASPLPIQKSYKILAISPQKFLLKTEKQLHLWNISQQSVKKIQVPACLPQNMDYMDGKVFIAERWVQFYDIGE